MGLADLIRSDLDRFAQTFFLRGQSHSGRKILIESLIFKAGFQAVLLYRLSNWFFKKGCIYTAWAVARLNVFLTGAEIEFNAEIGPGFFIAHPVGIVIGRGSVVGMRATIFQGACLTVRSWRPEEIRSFPRLGNDCVLFAHSMVMGGVSLGDECVIAAHSVVGEDMPAGSLAVGSPARIVPEKGREMVRSWRA